MIGTPAKAAAGSKKSWARGQQGLQRLHLIVHRDAHGLKHLRHRSLSSPSESFFYAFLQRFRSFGLSSDDRVGDAPRSTKLSPVIERLGDHSFVRNRDPFRGRHPRSLIEAQIQRPVVAKGKSAFGI